MTDVGLSDAVAALQRLDLEPQTRLVVEEAARLLQDGLDIEARALVEKAEALVARRSPGAAKANEVSAGAAAVMFLPIAEKLAAGFTGVLTSVLEEVYQHIGDRVQTAASQLEERLEALRQAQEETSGAVRILQQAALDTRVRAVEERVGVLEQLAREMEPRLACALAGLDRNTEALQWLEERHAQRVTALNQFLDTVSQLKETEPYRRDVRAAAAST